MEDKLFNEFKSELERGTFDGEYNSLMGAYPLDGYKIYFWFIEKKQAQLKEAIDEAYIVGFVDGKHSSNPMGELEHRDKIYNQFGIESEVEG
jgi:hypothetical protein